MLPCNYHHLQFFKSICGKDLKTELLTLQISFVTHIKVDHYPSLRSVPRATSKSHETKNKQILQPLSKSCPSIYMTQLRVTTKTNKSSNRCFIICGGQGLAVSYYLIICRGPGLVVCYCLIISPWSRVGGQLLFYDIGDLPPKPFREQSFQNKRFVRGFLEISQTKLPKRAFHARLPRNFSDRASNTKVSRETSSQFHRTSFQNERFVRGFLQISQSRLPKRTFRARLPRNFKELASKRSVSCEASSNFTEQASKTHLSREASSKFHRTSLQNERFVRGFLKFSHKTKLPKRTFRARLPQIFKEQAFKTNVSCEGSSNFHRTNFQNERFARDFLQISQNKPTKRAFRARLPQVLKEQSFQNERFARSFPQFP